MVRSGEDRCHLIRSDALENPSDARATDFQRRDGRPTDPNDEGIADDVPHDAAPTVAPEEEGGSPTTEHAPGGDL